MPANVNLYLDRMDLGKYCGDGCEVCKVDSFEEFAQKLRRGEVKNGACPHWPSSRIESFMLALNADEVIPPVPMLDMPRPVEPGLVEMNGAGPASPLYVTGNSEFTRTVMLAVLSRNLNPWRLLMVDTRGHTVDMAMVFKEFTSERVVRAVADYVVGIDPLARLVLPGLAAPARAGLEEALGRRVEVGPVCAAELPLYMGDDFVPAG